MGDFGNSHEGLAIHEIRPICWNETGKAVTKNGHLLGLHPRLSKSLLEYCNDMGITQIMRELTMDSHCRHCSSEDDDDDDSHDDGFAQQDDYCCDIDIRLQHEYDWFIQRVDGVIWQSDMHWLSPSDAKSVEHYLQALSRAGFDDVLKAIGEHFHYTGLVAYHMSVIAVSHCTPGSLHVDVTGTGDKSINVIIPLVRYYIYQVPCDALAAVLYSRQSSITSFKTPNFLQTVPTLTRFSKNTHTYLQILANYTNDPELQVRSDAPELQIGTFKYQYNVATLVGDDCFHATNSVNYHGQEMRMAATVYLADINEHNIAALTSPYVTYPKHYPPPSQPELLWQQAKRHWNPDDPSSKLPTTTTTTTTTSSCGVAITTTTMATAVVGESQLLASKQGDEPEPAREEPAKR
jgi:hypothetical protein